MKLETAISWWAVIAIVGFFLGSVVYKNCNSPSRITDDEQRATDRPYYYYTVGYQVRCYVDGKEVDLMTFQKEVCTKPDNMAGFDTCTATSFMNAQRDIGLGK